MTAPLRLTVHTRALDDAADLITATDAEHPVVWLRRGDGMAGFGEAARIEVDAAHDRSAEIARQWRELCARAQVYDEVNLPGTGLIGFGAFAFADDSALPSTLIVPEVVVGRRDGVAWLTEISSTPDVSGHLPQESARSSAPTSAPEHPLGAYWAATLGPGQLDHEGYRRAVTEAVAAISAGELDKVVLARDLRGSIPPGADLRRLVSSLATAYPDCWTYAVDGMLGASPETLVTVHGGTVTARVLAGTAARGADSDADTQAAATLATSEKNLEEHRYAVTSVLAALDPYTSALASSEGPFTLKLPNLWHLATDVEGTIAQQTSALDLLDALHPTAAVAGTPTTRALAEIRRREPFDRGRYAGPVGWVDARGDGEWAIALRCAQFHGTSVVAHAGAGIVIDSDPESELLETRVKFRPIVDALA